jgi:hypothetical protein
MNPQLLDQLASQHVAEIRDEASRIRTRAARPASHRERESIKERAGWTLIRAGLKLTGPPAHSQPASPRPASL